MSATKTSVKTQQTISIVCPVYNEQDGIAWFHGSLLDVLKKIPNYTFEVIYVNDGSKDESLRELLTLKSTKAIATHVVDLSRNFGKEAALAAGIQSSTGAAVISLDSDGQHPVVHIPEFISVWEQGNEVVIGIRETNKNEGFIKKYGSKWFYKIFNTTSGVELVPRSTDYRLLDRIVVSEFLRLNERNRMTRSLIDWLGFKREYIRFHANERIYGTATYTVRKLFELALNAFISLSALPLFISGYIGLTFMAIGFVAGLFVLIEQFILSDPLSLNISGSAMLGILTIFLVGIILSSQGLLGVYVSRLLSESQGRPLFIIRNKKKL